MIRRLAKPVRLRRRPARRLKPGLGRDLSHCDIRDWPLPATCAHGRHSRSDSWPGFGRASGVPDAFNRRFEIEDPLRFRGDNPVRRSAGLALHINRGQKPSRSPRASWRNFGEFDWQSIRGLRPWEFTCETTDWQSSDQRFRGLSPRGTVARRVELLGGHDFRAMNIFAAAIDKQAIGSRCV